MKEIIAMIAISFVASASGCATESKRVRAATEEPEKVGANRASSEDGTPQLETNTEKGNEPTKDAAKEPIKESEKEPAKMTCINSESIACGPFSDDQISACRKFSPQTPEAQTVCTTSKWDHKFYLEILSFLDSKKSKTN